MTSKLVISTHYTHYQFYYSILHMVAYGQHRTLS
jgi:hypothetical protein